MQPRTIYHDSKARVKSYMYEFEHTYISLFGSKQRPCTATQWSVSLKGPLPKVLDIPEVTPVHGYHMCYVSVVLDRYVEVKEISFKRSDHPVVRRSHLSVEENAQSIQLALATLLRWSNSPVAKGSPMNSYFKEIKPE